MGIKIKRKVPVLDAIVKRAVLARFPEVWAFSADGRDFYLSIKKELDAVAFAQNLAAYLFYLLDEFGEPGQSYTFHLLQAGIPAYRLIYEEGNNQALNAV
ncbi:hypothetical protein [Pedobacter sp. GR22-6]|uniref:hypothetical protein n=1 Tax=Pedobacter sp. GR22-6 TaxID=3127957 RepID=UPI00307F0086